MQKTICLLLLITCFACGQQSGPSSDAGDKDSTGTTASMADALQEQAEKKESSADIQTFIPAGYTILDTASGDLNLDAYPDMILVLKKNREDSTPDADRPEKRPLLILIAQPDQSYKLAEKSDDAVYCVNCGGVMGDPFTGIKIKKGYFSVEHYGGSADRWTRIVTFKYKPEDQEWYLFKDGGDAFSAHTPEKVKTTVYTEKDFGKVRFEKFDIYKEK
jgi:hypothetical protein